MAANSAGRQLYQHIDRHMSGDRQYWLIIIGSVTLILFILIIHVHLNIRTSLRISTSAENLSRNAMTFVEGQKNSLNQVVQHQVGYLGMIQDPGKSNQSPRDPEGQMVEKIEEAQLCGKVRIVLNEEDAVNMVISKHGIKIVDPKTEIVLQRHPLHRICQLVSYDDGLNKCNVVVKVGNVGKTTNSLFIFQCKTEDQAQKICTNLLNLFERIGLKKS